MDNISPGSLTFSSPSHSPGPYAPSDESNKKPRMTGDYEKDPKSFMNIVHTCPPHLREDCRMRYISRVVIREHVLLALEKYNDQHLYVGTHQQHVKIIRKILLHARFSVIYSLYLGIGWKTFCSCWNLFFMSPRKPFHIFTPKHQPQYLNS